jgi:hypothetical protein
LLSGLVNEITLKEVDYLWNHVQFFPHWVQFAVDSFPIACFQGKNALGPT